MILFANLNFRNFKMKNKLVILLIAILLSPTHLIACDACGSGVGNYYFGIMPQFHKNFVGLRYRHNSFSSHFSNISQSFANQEIFQTAEIWARYHITPKIQLLAFVPYSYNQQTENIQNRYLNGLNDIALLANYNLINTNVNAITDTSVRLLNHSLLVGGGIKLPSGKWDYPTDDPNQVANANFQLGSGSVDFMLNAAYTLRYQKWGINTDVSYKINTANANVYRFGNRISGNASLFYVQRLSKIALMPNAGVYVEQSMQSYEKHNIVSETGGYLLANTLGIETYFKRLSVGGNYQIPLAQKLNNGQTVGHNRVSVHFSVLF